MMTVVLYLVQVIIVSGLLYGYYHFVLRNSRFHQYNRFYVLGITILSLGLPLLKIDIDFRSSQEIPIVYQVLAEVRVARTVNAGTAALFTWPQFLQAIYWLIVFIFLLRIVLAVRRVLRLKLSHRCERLDDISIIYTREDGTPFSFFHWLFWHEEISVNSPEGKTILRHELFHIRQKHSWDTIAMELVTAIFWFNPFFHLAKRELKAIHEFLADRYAIAKNNKWDYAELLLMQALQTRHRFIHPFFHNQIKRRIAMINKSSNPGYQYLRKLMVVPLAFLLVSLIAVNCTSKDLRKEFVSEKSDDTKNKKQQNDLKSALMDSTNGIVREQVNEYMKKLKKELVERQNKGIVVELSSPSFAGGRPAWQQFLQKNLNPNVPVDNGAGEGTYTVITQFMVSRNGRISDIKALTHLGHGMEEEVVRVMKLSPPWIPAMQDGRAVNVYTKQPVTFSIVAE
jgi:bla regulator protein blaR1